MGQIQRYTWDGLPVAQDEPHGATIVVRRLAAGVAGEWEYLLLHRAHRGPQYEGDWAWTPPAGSRQPGEPVLKAALRELAEETGLHAEPENLRVIDLRGGWALFALDVPPDAAARVDPEHDRLEWLSLTAAAGRCKPAVIEAGLRRAAAVPRPALAYRALAYDDLPDMVRWQGAPHAARWFPGELDLETARRKYGPRIDGGSPVAVHVVLADDQPCGFAQHYRVSVDPGYAAATGEPDAIGIDYAIGVQALTGQGLGPNLIWQYVRQVVLAAHPGAASIVASPATANEPSILALEKAGFRRVREIVIDGEPAPELLCALDCGHFFGPARP